MSSDSAVTILLPERLDRTAALGLKSELDSNEGQSIRLDGSENTLLSGPGLQLICFARQHWEASGWGFEIHAPSENLAEALNWFEGEQDLDFGEN